MVGRQQDSVACVQRCAESLGADKLTGSDTVVFAKISRRYHWMTRDQKRLRRGGTKR
jgi:hypothetical protein